VLKPGWRWVTLLAILACATNVALGFWQLGRLSQRHALSAQLAARLSAPPVALASARFGSQADFDALQFHRATVRGTFDYQHEVALVNEVWDGQLGLHLLTPLRLAEGARTVVVDRGWIPAADADPAAWAKYRTPASGDGEVDVTGWVREGKRSGRTTPVGPDRLVDDVDVARLAGFDRQEVLPVYLIQVPDVAPGAPQPAPPYRTPPVTDLGDGVHLIVAAQWFALAVIIAAGYLAYANKYIATATGARPAVRINPAVASQGPRPRAQSAPAPSGPTPAAHG
jgi:surfeit locus 1 family protein